MELIFCMIVGYLIGSLNPAALISKLKKRNLREHGTGNLGATNIMLNFGKTYGVLVMLFDIAKGFVAVRFAQLISPALPFAGLIAGTCAVVGHVFPFYLKFKGGKGLAAFGGMILGVDPKLFLALLILTVVLMILVNYSVAMPMSAGILFPLLYGLRTRSFSGLFLAAISGVLIICKHFSNIGKARRGEDVKIREYVKSLVSH